MSFLQVTALPYSGKSIHLKPHTPTPWTRRVRFGPSMTEWNIPWSLPAKRHPFSATNRSFSSVYILQGQHMKGRPPLICLLKFLGPNLPWRVWIFLLVCPFTTGPKQLFTLICRPVRQPHLLLVLVNAKSPSVLLGDSLGLVSDISSGKGQ